MVVYCNTCPLELCCLIVIALQCTCMCVVEKCEFSLRMLSHCCDWLRRRCSPVYPLFTIDFYYVPNFFVCFLKVHQSCSMQECWCTFGKCTKTTGHNESLWQTTGNPHENHGYTVMHLPCSQTAVGQYESTLNVPFTMSWATPPQVFIASA